MNHSFAIAILFTVSAVAAAKEPKPLDPVAQIAVNLEPTRKVVYKNVGDRALEMHVFEPEGFKASDKRACFLVIHGGGWSSGEPRRMYPFADHYRKLGLVGISLQYRLEKKSQKTTPWECVKDGRSAVRYLKTHAGELGIDPARIVVSGGSAGGHVAAATALFDGIDEAGEDTSVSSVPAALVLLYPVIDTSSEGYGNARLGERWKEISPAHHVKPGVPPTLILHGTADPTTPFKGAELFTKAMHEAGNRCDLIAYQGGHHGYLMFDAKLYAQALDQIDAFLRSLTPPLLDAAKK
jgi:acetyl esterase/lipase